MGRKKLKDEEKINRNIRLNLSLSSEEFETLKSRKGNLCLATFARLAILKQLPPVVPELNREAWLDLSRASGNLATVACDMRSGEFIESSELRRLLSEFRTSLITNKETFFSYCQDEKSI